ncbi:prenyltransferase [Candidatus Omnitrophota bacterium]
MNKIANYIRAVRLPFIAASIFPFIAGSLLAQSQFKVIPFILGLFSVVCAHLGANLMNDYADSKSGADWQDKTFYGFFGGSKLIQENVLSERFYLVFSIICFAIAFACVGVLAVLLQNVAIIGYCLLVMLLGFSYSHKPLQLSYHRLGEIIIFLLFGCAPVMGAYYIQTGVFPTLKSFLLSLPFGFFTTAILFSNEVPDFETDSKAKKYTWVSITGAKGAYILYGVLVTLGFASVILNVIANNLHGAACIAIVFAGFSYKAFAILKNQHEDKAKLIESSKATIAVQALVSIVIIAGVIL